MAPTVTRHEVGLLRLVAQGLVGVAPGTGPLDAVRHLLAVQAQDLPGAVRSTALRTQARSRADVVAALDDGTVVRTWPVRGTLHLVATDDLAWLLRTTAARVVDRFAGRRAELGIDAATLERAAAVADALLAAPGGALRADLLRAWEDAGITTTGQRGYHLVVHLAHTGLLCLGPTTRAGQGSEPGSAEAAASRLEQRLVRVAEQVGADRPVAGDEALAELARRYLTGHGPATVHDLARWAGVTVRQARTGLHLARPHLGAVDVDGAEHWLDPAVPDRLAACRADALEVLLLPGFDEYLLGYADRGAVLGPEHAQRIVPGGNGVFRPTVVDAGQVVGTWRSTPPRGGAAPGLQVEPFAALTPQAEAGVAAAHARLP